MIIKWNKYNESIDNKPINKNIDSVYTIEDINDILDKDKLDASDKAILNSYATNDKEIKEIISKIESFRKKFQELNQEIKNRKKNIKNRIKLQEKWIKMNKQLSKYENDLRYRFKISDPKKIRKYFNEI